MSKHKYKVQVTELKDINEMPEGWTNTNYIELLKFLDVENPEDTPTDELRDTAGMALIDFEPEEAAEKLLEFRFGDQFNAGQRENIAVDARRLKLWERYPDVAFHQEMFNVCYLLHVAFPMKFHEPDAAYIKLEIKGLNPDSSEMLKNPDSGFIARILADGMNEHSTLNRLYDAYIKGEKFPDAEDIIWRYDLSEFNESEHMRTIIIYTSWNWVDELKGVEEYDSTAYNDEKEE